MRTLLLTSSVGGPVAQLSASSATREFDPADCRGTGHEKPASQCPDDRVACLQGMLFTTRVPTRAPSARPNTPIDAAHAYRRGATGDIRASTPA
jgi:hypothetical protein